MPGGTAPTPPTATSRTTPRGGSAKPRPRAGIQRKTKAERDQFAKEEAERQKARAAEHEVANRGARGGRGTARGGRNGAAAGQREGPVEGGGVFGAGSSTKPAAKSRTSYEGYGELLTGHQDISALGKDATGGYEGTGQVGTSTGGKGGTSRTAETLDMDTDDEPDDEGKRDIERIWISSDEDEEIVASTSRKGKQKATSTSKRMPRIGLGLRPVRAPRTLGEEEEQEGDTAGLASKKSRTAAGPRADTETQELDKQNERDEDSEDEENELFQFVKEQPSSPEVKKRTLKKQPAAGKIGRDVKGSATETTEERAERMRAMRDVQKLRDLFVTAPAADAKMEADDEDDEEQPVTSLKDGHLFLFQLPPLTPFLVDSGAMQTNETVVKVEPTTGDGITTIDLDGPDVGAMASNTTTDPEIKVDPDAPARPNLQIDGLLTASEPIRLPAGVVGKLHVHKSGKVTLDWGGTDMEVRYGTEVNFLQDVVLVEPGQKQEGSAREGEGTANGEDEHGDSDLTKDDGGDDNDGSGRERKKKDFKGTVYALGQVKRKMILIPDWAKLYD
ncbi:uncharacterized protein Z519_01698 [Cladophialophora bantiana CBS 173.52]|uniref:DNA-directed RNA polymerase III RPC4 n=1 Tax=Cladophialophora bantiana (strain ATCC 10958 / CBS 173.52 / CDC B-1940 / NIH 8579) TaxID=1442370 RepID=A0A0D2IMW2_CLAB1|nr:uncharacterized protein Z519_01698 [Cladophialophora bantiana CBS 173.52]KIW98114.1 hypothetical protein Z519_01698 [Cladophialophora bantiana CBS 173.52]